MTTKAQMCYTDEELGNQMLITIIGINSQREQHMISTIKTLHLIENLNLLEDEGGTYYISYKIYNKTRDRDKKVIMGWSKTPPVPAQPMYIQGFEAGKLDYEMQDGKNPEECPLRLYILDDKIFNYGNVYVCDAIILGDPITAVIMVNYPKES